MKAKIAAAVAVLMLPILFGFVLVTPAQALTGAQLPDVTWLKGTIDNKSTTQQWLSETVDPSGFVHVSYYDSSLSVLMYATNADGSWKTSQIGTTNNGMFNSIASDRNGVIHLAYYDSANNKLYYINNNGGTWSSPTLIDSGGKYVSLAVDVSGHVHIAYQDANGQKVMYADNTAGSWSSPVIVDGTGISGQGISIAVDNAARSYVSYYESVNSQLRFASNVNGNWANEQVSGTGLVAPFTALAMNNASGIVMIIYYDQTHQMLKSVQGVSGSWSTPTTVDTVVGAPFASIVMDSNLDMHIAYYDKANATLKYANNEGGVWTTYVVDPTIYSNGVVSIDLDSYNKVHIAYMSASSHLMYVTSSGSKWALSTLEAVGDVGSQSVMAIDNAGNIHIAYIDNTDIANPKLMYLTNANGGWQDEFVANHSISPSIALSSNGKVYMSYQNNSVSQKTLRYSTNDNGAWVSYTVDSGEIGLVNSIVAGKNGTLFIAYRDESSRNLLIAEYANDSKISINTMDADHITGSNIGIVLDSNNKVFVVYSTDNGLKMVTNKEGTWLPSVIDPHAGAGLGLSMLIDSSNQIHVSYYDQGTNELVYRYYSGSIWSAKDLILSNVQVADTSVVLDSKGSPRIAVSMVGVTNNTLRVMEKIGGIWMSSDVDTSSIGSSVSIVVDKYDRYHVIYYGVDNKDLLYTISITSPTSPSNVGGTRGDHFVRLTWATPTSNGGADVAKYIVYRGESPGTEVSIGEVSGTSLLFNDTTVTNANTEYYTVVAVNSEGASVASHEFSINPYSSPAPADNSLMLLIIAGVIGVVVIAVAVILVMRRVKPKNKWKQ
ncbi:MAG: hypothetical protein ABR986_01535 [Methanomassiliicoccales archaeon]|jgi:hypothetical protein